MTYDFPPFRPPSEAGSYLIRAVRGCNWNRCGFCAMYKGMKFELRKKEDVLRDIDSIPRYFPPSRTAFIGDSNPLIHPDIAEIIRYLREKRKEVERVTAYARIKTIAKMPESRLEELKEAGLTRLHMGLESGDREVLELVQKGITPEDAITAGKKARKYFELTYYVMPGLGGRERSEQHAVNTARVINKAQPTFVRLRTLTVIEGTPIEKLVGKEITLLGPVEQLEEVRRLVEEIKVETLLLSDHVSNYLFTRSGPIFFGVSGKLPDEKEQMLEQVDDAIKTVKLLEESGERVFNSNDMYRMGLIGL